MDAELELGGPRGTAQTLNHLGGPTNNSNLRIENSRENRSPIFGRAGGKFEIRNSNSEIRNLLVFLFLVG
jgi:hypothetical protein